MLKCKHPISVVVDGKHYEVGCGRCRDCLNKKRRQWSQRLQMEHESRVCTKFVTITYDDFHLPPLYSDVNEYGEERFWYTLNKRDCQLFFKRLRKSFTDCLGKFSYFLVGEFGDKTARPHYHLIMFFDKRVTDDELKISILKTWQKGYIIDVQDLRGVGGCKYVADYLYKQLGDDGLMKDRFNEELLNIENIDDFSNKWRTIFNRPKTFCLSSRRPAIGLRYVTDSKKKFHKRNIIGNSNYIAKGDDTGFKQPLCKYIRNKIYSDSELEILRSHLENQSKIERENWERENPLKDYNIYVKNVRKFHDFKLKQKEK